MTVHESVPLPDTAPVCRSSLNRQIMVWISVTLLCTILVIASAIYWFIASSERAAWENRQSEAARHAGQVVSNFLHHMEAVIMVFGMLGYDEVAQPLSSDTSWLLDSHPALLEIAWIGASAQVTLSTHRLTPILADVFTVPQARWYHEALQGNRFLGNVEVSSRSEPYLIMALPDGRGGVIAARLNMRVLWDEVSSLRFGRTGTAYVVNREGRIIAHPDTEIALSGISLKGRPEMTNVTEDGDEERSISYENFASVDVHGVRKVIPGTNWILFTELAHSEAYATSQFSLLVLGAGILMFGCLTIGLILRTLTALIFKPLEDLRAGAIHIGQGNLGHRIAIARLDEVGEVAGAFNDMAQCLLHRDEQLAARTRALTEEIIERRRIEDDLRRAKEAAEDANRCKSDFLARMSHEIRTPMSGVLGMAELLLGTALDDKQRGFASTILQSGQTLLRVLNDTLDFSRIEADQLVFEHIAFDLRGCIHGVATAIGEVAHMKGLQFGVDIAEEVPTRLYGDPVRLQQILGNLLGNAVKFTERGSVVLRVALQETSTCGVRLAFEVSDTGIGIPEANQERIFQAFTQGDGSTTRRYGGSGLGLTIARQLIEMMEGQIQLRSTVGEGTTFSFTVRMARVAAGEAKGHGHGEPRGLQVHRQGQGISGGQSPMAGATLPSSPPPSLEPSGPRSISPMGLVPKTPGPEPPLGQESLSEGAPQPQPLALVAEDEPVLRFLINKSLEEVGFRVEEAEHGLEALSLFHDVRPDIILLDIMMPHLDGFGVCSAIRALPAGTHVPVIMVTGLNDIDSIRRAYHVGATDFITKPFNYVVLGERVRYIWRSSCLGEALRRNEAQIKASLEEKEVLLREVHHRVKNNLQTISSLLRLQSRQIGDPQLIELFRDSQDRIRSMALIHEKLYRSTDLARIDFVDYMRALGESLVRSYTVSPLSGPPGGRAGQGVHLNVAGDRVFLEVETAIPCALLINELVSNALRHAFQGDEAHKEIRIELRRTGPEGLNLVVGDNGIGFPENLDFRHTTSLGLQLVVTLAQQLKGTIELDRSGGTTFRVTFHELKYKKRR